MNVISDLIGGLPENAAMITFDDGEQKCSTHFSQFTFNDIFKYGSIYA